MIRRINLFGGPSAGKSTTAADIFSAIKKRHISCELIKEAAKDRAYMDYPIREFDQSVIFGQQIEREYLPLRANVRYVVTDSPLMVQATYAKWFKSSVWPEVTSQSHKFDLAYPSLNIYLGRGDIPYETTGRWESEEEARAKDAFMLDFLAENNVSLVRFGLHEAAIAFVMNSITEDYQASPTCKD